MPTFYCCLRPALGAALLTATLPACRPPAEPTARAWVSQVNVRNTGMAQGLAAQPAVAFVRGVPDTARYSIRLAPDSLYQPLDGFGASLTEASAYLLHAKLSPAAHDTVMQRLFSPRRGIGLSMLRQPIGACDHVRAPYTYDDAALPDTTLSGFDIGPDRPHILPVLQQALAVAPGRIKVTCATWSPPAWMKTNHAIVGKAHGIEGHLRPDCYRAYARYLVRFIDAYAQAGIPIYATSIQNEPDHASDTWPAMKMTAAEQRRLVADHLGPLLQGRNVKIWCWDHNFNTPGAPRGQFAREVLGDPQAARYVAGSAWHWYSDGFPEVLAAIGREFPDKEIHFTEGSGGEWNPVKKWRDGFLEEMRYLINLPRVNCRSAVLWNIALDEHNGPDYYYRAAGSQSTCRGLLTVNQQTGAVTYNADYYALGHLSKFVDPGARRMASNHWPGRLENVAFRNPDGGVVAVVCNRKKTPKTFTLRYRGRTLRYTLAGEAALTLTWPADPAAQP